jgi:hypothetical protein
LGSNCGQAWPPGACDSFIEFEDNEAYCGRLMLQHIALRSAKGIDTTEDKSVGAFENRNTCRILLALHVQQGAPESQSVQSKALDQTFCTEVIIKFVC